MEEFIQKKFKSVIEKIRKDKEQMQNQDSLSTRITNEMMKKLTKKFGERRIILRCIVTDSSDEAVAYSLSKDKQFGEAYVVRAADNSFSFTCLICII